MRRFFIVLLFVCSFVLATAEVKVKTLKAGDKEILVNEVNLFKYKVQQEGYTILIVDYTDMRNHFVCFIVYTKPRIEDSTVLEE